MSASWQVPVTTPSTFSTSVSRSPMFRSTLRPHRRSLSTATASANASTTTESSTTRRIGAVLFSGCCGATATLCYWQTQRYQWKLRLIDERQASLAASPQPLRALVPDPSAGLPEAQQFQRVTLEGTFDHSHQVLVGPRSAPAGAGVGGNAPAGAANQSGWDVLTPLACSDGTRVLINRGWVPRDAVASVEQPAGRQVVSGVLKAGEARNKYATNDVPNRRYVWLDLDTVAAESGSSPLLVVSVGSDLNGGAAAATSRRGEPRWPHARPLDSFMKFNVMPSTHVTYAATWASLTVAGGIITYLRFIK